MGSYLINTGKSVLNKTADYLARGFNTSLTGAVINRLRASYQESFTAQLLRRDLTGRSYTYALAQAVASKCEKRLRLPEQFVARWRPAAGYGVLLAMVALAALALITLPWQQALIALGAIIIAAATLYKTEAGLYAAALLLPFVPFKALFLLSLLTLFSFILSILSGARRFRFHLSPLLVPLLLLYLVFFYATITSVLFYSSASEFLIPVTGLIYLFVMVNVFDSREKLDNFVFCLAVAAAITAGYAIFQFYNGANILEMKKEWLDITKNTDIKNRAYAVFENPNLLAQYMVLSASLSLGFIFSSASRGRQIFFAFTAGLSIFCLVLTYSRGGWLAFAAALVIFALFKNKLLLQTLPVAGFIAYWFLPKTILQRLSTITSLKDSSNAYRLDTWHSTISLIKSHWETGVGLGRIAFSRVYYTHAHNSNMVPHSHNLYLQIIGEFGILGMVVFIWLLLAIFRLGLKLCSVKDYYVRNINAGIMAALAGFLVHSTVDYFLWYYKLGILLWLLIAVLLVTEKFAQERRDIERNEL